MTGTVSATATETAIAEETTSASAMPARAAGKPVAVPVSRAIGGPRQRRRSDQRWEVTEADLNMYGLIVGRSPSESERVAALTPVPNEATALRDAGAGLGGVGQWGRGESGDGRTWSPAVMFAYLRDVYYFGANLTHVRLTGPQVSAWVRHLSTEARRRLQESQARLAAPRTR